MDRLNRENFFRKTLIKVIENEEIIRIKVF
jgi:hypothetical protein